MLHSIYLPAQEPPQKLRVTDTYDGKLRVEADEVIRDFVNGTFEWRGKVVATYGPNKVLADRLVIHDREEDQFGEAIGSVTLTDPEGVITATDLRFKWKDNTGTAHNVVVRVSTLTLTAEAIDIQPDLWKLTNVGGTNCQLRTPLYYIRTRELTVQPNKGGKIVKPEISILGRKVATLPTQTFSFGGRGSSLDLPLPQYRPDRGFGLSWQNHVDFSPQTTLLTNYAVYQRSLPAYTAYLMHSFLPGVAPRYPRSELGQRFEFGYFDNVQVGTPEDERRYLRNPRANLSVGTNWGAAARDTTTEGEKINKPLEVVAEGATSVGGFGFFGIIRPQQVRLGDGPTLSRVLVEANIGSPALELGKNLSAGARIDTATYLGESRYGWQRAQAHLLWAPTSKLRFGAAYSAGAQQGTPDFAYDRLDRSREFSLRGDLDLDTTQIRMLLQFDPRSKRLFDQEIYFSQVVGCIEPFIVYRRSPRKFFIGIKLPIFRDFERIARQERFRRTIISGPPSP